MIKIPKLNNSDHSNTRRNDVRAVESLSDKPDMALERPQLNIFTKKSIFIRKIGDMITKTNTVWRVGA